MRIFTPLKAGVCLAALMTTNAALADVTAQQVWDTWKENITVLGDDALTVGAEDLSGGTLTVRDIRIETQENGTTFAADIGDILFIGNDDGTVTVTMPTSFPVTVREGSDGVDLSVTQTNLQITASGTPEALNYALSADQYAVSLDSITAPSGPQPEGEVRVTANGITGNYLIDDGDIRNLTYAIGTDTIDVLVDLTEPESGDTVLMSGQISGMTASAIADIPTDADFEEPDTLLLDGFAVEGGYGMESATFLFDMNVEGDQGNGTVSLGMAELGILINRDRFGYNFVANDVSANVETAELPFPVSMSVGQYGIGLNFPTSASDVPEPFSVGVNITDLAVDDALWMMADPTAQLPRDPVTFVLDLTGEGRLFYDLFDPEQADQMARAEVPGELAALTLNDLTLRAAGAAVAGTGAFTFDNSDLATFDGFPRPMGEATFNIDGANQLIDTLIAMGLVPEQQAMMGRMMMGMFARTVGEDQLTTTLEINDLGQVFANGQRIQ